MFRCILKIIFILLASYIFIFFLFWLDVIFGWHVVFFDLFFIYFIFFIF